jgi:hypothetical protein
MLDSSITGGEEELDSDIRLKTDVVKVGTTIHALPLYQFSYVTGEGRYEGVMAQDVLESMPEAVTTSDDGFYRVNYSKLGIKMRRVH